MKTKMKKLLALFGALFLLMSYLVPVFAAWDTYNMTSGPQKNYALGEKLPFYKWEKIAKKRNLGLRALSGGYGQRESFRDTSSMNIYDYSVKQNFYFLNEDGSVSDYIPAVIQVLPNIEYSDYLNARKNEDCGVCVSFFFARTEEIENRFVKNRSDEAKKERESYPSGDIRRIRTSGYLYPDKSDDEYGLEFTETSIGKNRAFVYYSEPTYDIEISSYKDNFKKETLPTFREGDFGDHIYEDSYEGEVRHDLYQANNIEGSGILYVVLDNPYEDIQLIMRATFKKTIDLDKVHDEYYSSYKEHAPEELWGGLRVNQYKSYFDDEKQERCTKIIDSWTTGSKLKAFWFDSEDGADSFAKTTYNNYNFPQKFTNIVQNTISKVFYTVKEYSCPVIGGPALVVDKDAMDTAGEDKGTTIPKIIIGVVGSIAVAGAAAAAAISGGGKPNGENDGKDDESSYRLYVEKDFGNKLKLGDRPRNIHIKIKKILPDGTVINRTDMGDSISVESGKYITVGDPIGRSDFTVTAAKSVSLTVEEFPDGVTEDYISIVFTADGGIFTENLHFRILGKTVIGFPQKEHYLDGLTIPAIAGDAMTYKIPFVFENAMAEPKKITFACDNSGMEFSFEKTGELSYNAVFKNLTEKVPCVYQNPVKSKVEIHAEFPIGSGDWIVDGVFRVEFFPEGLSIQTQQLKDERIQINSFEKDKVGDLETKIDPLYLQLHIVKKNEKNGVAAPRFVQLRTNIVTIGEIKAAKDEEYIQNMLPKFEYDTSEYDIEDGNYIIYPKKEIPAFYLENDTFKTSPMQYEVILPISVKIENETYSMDAPAVINGKVIDKMGLWQDEYDKLMDVIKRYIPEEEKETFLKTAQENAKYRSAEELRIEEKSIIQEAIRRYTTEGMEHAAWADTLDWIVGGLEWTKWVGDVAFSYVANAYTGPIGEAFLSCCKDVFVAVCGELGVNWYHGTTFNVDNLEIFKNLDSMCENMIGSEMDIKDFADPTKYKKAILAVSGFFMYNAIKTIVKNHNMRVEKAKEANQDPDKVEWNILDGLLEAFTNLTSKFFQDLAGLYVEKLLSNEKFREKLGNIMGDWLKNMLNSKMLEDIAEYKKGSYHLLSPELKEAISLDQLKDKVVGDAVKDLSDDLYAKFCKSDIVTNYLKKLVGDGVAGLYSAATDASKQVQKGDMYMEIFPFVQTNDDAETLKLIINFSAIKRNLIAWYDSAMETGSNALNQIGGFLDFIYQHTVFSLIPAAEKPVQFSKDVPVQTKGSM